MGFGVGSLQNISKEDKFLDNPGEKMQYLFNNLTLPQLKKRGAEVQNTKQKSWVKYKTYLEWTTACKWILDNINRLCMN